MAEFDSSWPDEGGFDATDPDPPLQVMTDTVLDCGPEGRKKEADAIAGELLAVMGRNAEQKLFARSTLGKPA